MKRILILLQVSIFFQLCVQTIAFGQVNIVYVFTDQQTSTAMSSANNPYLSTPNMDKLAERGIRFSNAYCSFPLCTPARASMMTGLTASNAGVLDNNYGLEDHIRDRSMGVIFSREGYKCVYAGKWHLPEYNIDNSHGFEKISNFGDDKVADSCVYFLNHASHDTPFLLVASLDNPHNICEFARGQDLPWGNVDIPDAIELLPNVPANYCIPPYEPNAIRKEQAARKPVYPGRDFNVEEWRKYIYAYYRLVEKVDKEVGKIIDAVYANGLEDNTLIVFASDHGDGVAAHQWNQKTVLYENSVKVPFIIVPPNSERGFVSEIPVNASTDLLPTMLEYAGIDHEYNFDGISLKKLCESIDNFDESAFDSRYIFTETNFKTIEGEGTDGFMLRKGDYKYIAYYASDKKPQEQLFNLKNDSGEMVNLAVVDLYENTLNDFRNQLLNILNDEQ